MHNNLSRRRRGGLTGISVRDPSQHILVLGKCRFASQHQPPLRRVVVDRDFSRPSKRQHVFTSHPVLDINFSAVEHGFSRSERSRGVQRLDGDARQYFHSSPILYERAAGSNCHFWWQHFRCHHDIGVQDVTRRNLAFHLKLDYAVARNRIVSSVAIENSSECFFVVQCRGQTTQGQHTGVGIEISGDECACSRRGIVDQDVFPFAITMGESHRGPIQHIIRIDKEAIVHLDAFPAFRVVRDIVEVRLQERSRLHRDD